MNVQKTKTVDVTVEAKRAVAMLNGAYGVGMFVVLLGIPILNLIIGFFVLLSLAAPIFTRSARIGVDLGWLLIGTAICLVGMLAYPVLPMLNYTTPWPAVFLGAALRAIVFWWIVQGKLGHLYSNQHDAVQI